MEQRKPNLSAFVMLVAILLGMLAAPVGADIRFEEVTASAGITYSGPSWGASWADLDGDGLPDLWVTNHELPPSLYLNNGNGTFTDIGPTLGVRTGGDKHGAAWADFDNDGDQDLIQLTGGPSGSNRVLRNTGGVLREEIAAALGLDYPLGRGRAPLWLDWDNDGWLDVLLVNLPSPDGQGPTALFRQTATGFSDVSRMLGLDTNGQIAQLSDISGDGRVDLLIGDILYPRRVYDLGSIPLVNLTGTLMDQMGMPATTGFVQDSVIADFNGDLLPDLFMVRSSLFASDLVHVTPNSLEAALLNNHSERGFSFRTADAVSFELGAAPRLDPTLIFLGASGRHPDATSFTLSPQDQTVWGTAPHTPGGNKGVYIGYQPDQQKWQVLHSCPSFARVQFVVSAPSPISDATTIGFHPFTPKTMNKLLLRTADGFVNYTPEAGLADPSACNSVGAGDFDNDKDIDLYLVCTGLIHNRPDVLYENQGDGTFVAVPMAGGAEGSTEGRGESVAVADYDMDGFLDLFVTNGEGPPPFNRGPDQLFRNLGNPNHWLELDLEGVVSNRDGVGARLFLASGGVTQLREQVGGMHERTQDHARLHFGLANDVAVDSLIVKWPSGITQTINALPANELVRVVEPSTPSVLGKPSYVVGASEGVFLWKNTPDGPYHLRANGGGKLTRFNVKLLANARPTAVLPVSVESGDQLVQSDFGFALSFVVSINQDGVDFQLPAGAQALLSVDQMGVPNPRQLHVGASGAPLSPAGWIKSADELPPRPRFTPGKDLGLFIGHGSSPQVIEARWDADRFPHHADLTLMATTPIIDAQPANLESNDMLQRTENEVRVQSLIAAWWDGVNITLSAGSDIGLAYVQDGLFQSHRVNHLAGALGQPNAYWLP